MLTAGIVWMLGAAVAFGLDTAPETVTLAAAGTGAQEVRTLHPAAGAHQALALTRSLKVTITAMGQAQSMEEPRVEADLDLDVKGVFDGGANVVWTYVATRGGGGTMSGSYSGLKGTTGSFTVTADGDLDGTFSKGFDLDLWTVRLPAEPIAVGATWTVKSSARSDEGVLLEETQTVTFVGMDAGRMVLKVILEQVGQPTDTVVQGMAARIERHRAVGVGDLVVDPKLPLAVSGTWTIDLDVGLVMGGGAIKSGQKSHLELSLGTRG